MEEIVGGLFRVLGRFIFEIVFTTAAEVMFQIPGHLLCKLFTKKGQEPNGFWVVVVSILFWVLVVALGYFTYQAVTSVSNA
ncbi:DUF4228 domain-containing protein [Shewanella insulae]|uniref:DUF4228 domain-containing protein n=1 Tax=Shewanella insulae TaxID=2681496 RepID=UPI001EFCB95A|nr:DUF4228 domain-containing protein [Shewanella insulae]MCG9739536.1 DUF4228 domain-containing protein [Shewanella insulae]